MPKKDETPKPDAAAPKTDEPAKEAPKSDESKK
jgi:hypothetical protein